MAKACYFMGNQSFEVKEQTMPQPSAHEVVVRVKVCGICGTDVHIYYGEKGSAAVTPPVVLGHELAGEIVAVGSNANKFAVGNHVAVDPNIYCGNCDYCQNGKKQLCAELHATGVTLDGGFADYCVVNEQQCIELAPEVPYEIGALAEPLACCIHGIDRANIRQGETVCVIGCGAIGLLMVQLAKLSGASQVVVSEPVEMRRDIAMQLGATSTIDPTKDDLLGQFKSCTSKAGADVVIECVGHVKATEQAVALADKGARILLFSVPKPETAISFDLSDIFSKELTIASSFVNPDTQARAVALINSKALILEPLVTHRFPLNKLADAIQKQMDNDSIKVVVMPHMQ